MLPQTGAPLALAVLEDVAVAVVVLVLLADSRCAAREKRKTRRGHRSSEARNATHPGSRTSHHASPSKRSPMQNGVRMSQVGLPPVDSTTALELESDSTVLGLSVDRSNTVPTTAARGDEGG